SILLKMVTSYNSIPELSFQLCQSYTIDIKGYKNFLIPLTNEYLKFLISLADKDSSLKDSEYGVKIIGILFGILGEYNIDHSNSLKIVLNYILFNSKFENSKIIFFEILKTCSNYINVSIQ